MKVDANSFKISSNYKITKKNYSFYKPFFGYDGYICFLMNFLYPQFLFALIAVLIPVIIHLFNFQRYKKVHFSNVAFLKEVKHSTKAKSNLKHLLILISRILVITFIVLAFTQPFIPLTSTTASPKTLKTSIFIDNSFSTENQNMDGRVFDLSRELGYLITDELPNHVHHQLLTNDFSGAEQHHFSTLEIKNRLSSITINPKSEDLLSITKRQKSSFEKEPFSSIIISDFQKSQFDFEKLNSDSNIRYTLIPVEPAVTKNISIDSIWFVNPVHRLNQKDEIHFRLRNYNNQDAINVRTTLFINDIQKSFSNISIPANSYIDTAITYNNDQSGWQQGYLNIEDSPIQFDNTFYFSYNISEEINVLSISSNESQQNIAQAFNVDPFFKFTEMNQNNIDFSELSSTNLLILNEVTNLSSGMISSIEKYVSNGGYLAIFPNVADYHKELNTLLTNVGKMQLSVLNEDSTHVNYIDLESSIYNEVFTNNNEKVNLPDIYKHYQINNNGETITHDLLKTVNQDAVLTNWKYDKGTVFLFSIPLSPEYSNFRLHSIFLPTLFQIAFNSTLPLVPYIIIGEDNRIQLPHVKRSNNDLFHVVNEKLQVDVIPEMFQMNNEIKLGLHGSIQKAGNFKVMSDDSLISTISLNYTRKESNPTCYTSAELENIIDSLSLYNFSVFNSSINEFKDDFKKRDSGIELWRWFVILSLVFLGIEIILIRYFKPSVI